MTGQERGGPQESSLWVAAGRYTGYGLTFALSTLLFLLVGWWIDGKLGTMPLFLILGALVGGGGGFYSLYHHLVVEPRDRDEDAGN